MTKKELFKRLERFKKSGWLPVTSDGDGELTASKFSGIPWLAPNEHWPSCPNCHKPLNLFVQLNLENLPFIPKKFKSKGLIQLFYCTNSDPHCELDCESFFPFSKSVIARLVDPSASKPKQISSSPVIDAFPPKHIIDWEIRDDYPNWDELSEQGINLSNEEENLLYDLEFPLAGDKLFGWPAWVQGVEYPNCPDCGQRMQLVFQIDSEDNLPYMFGDVGCGHITQCPEHPNQLAFGWACA